MTEWKEYKLGNVADVQTGPFGSQLHMSDYQSEGTPIITVEHLGDNRIIHNNLPLVGDEDKKRLSKYVLSEGDIVFSRVGSVDRRAYVSAEENGWMFSGRCLRVRPSEKVDSKYLSYYFGLEDFKETIRRIAVGATMPSINTPILSNVIVTLPSLDEQRRIASILTSLDDKIDLLRRENATLEAMAETLFRQWFVVEAKEEWEEGKLGDWVVIKRGGSPRPINDYIAPTGYRWLKISDVTNLNSPYIFQTKEYIKESGLQKTVYLRKGSLVLSNSATPGIPKILCVDSCIHDGWLYFPKSSFSKIYLYLLFKYIREDLVNLGNGSIFTNLKTDILKDYKVVKPDAKTLENFDHHVQPIFDKLYSNDIQIQTLIQTRDGLLPRLMNNEIKVE